MAKIVFALIAQNINVFSAKKSVNYMQQKNSPLIGKKCAIFNAFN